MDIGISKDDRTAIADALSQVLADTYALYMKTHNYHWNVEGPQFSAYHAMFELQYTELWAALDEIAERIRSLGLYAPAVSEIYERSGIKQDTAIPSANDMIANLVADNETVVRAARDALKLAGDKDDDATADLMTQRAAASEKAAWMLRSHIA
ncbi:Ferritin Dps family protein [Hirschia baltica ATCC 49814]|uniref:Ferritin Dps family protein n=2 Tax=Hirschia TaxID=2723 RepID=C6XRG0_HIRBI|nr:Dps family protein [Hirschia baltica]ACT58792.1 Ferritin Dps family protein [Hirschia baltica ATCC 49814]